jgi:RNA polymerase sigma-B factor
MASTKSLSRNTSSNPTPISRRRGRFVERDRMAEELFLELSRTTNCAERDRLTDEIVRLHLDLCDGVAARYSGRSIPTEDLVQVARLALVVAIKRYKPGPGTSFIGYALPTISGELKRHFRDHGWMVRPPRRLQELGPVLRLAREHWEQEHGTAPTPHELAEEIGVESGQVVECLSAEHSYHPLSLDLTFGDDESRSLAETLAEPQEELETAADRVTLSTALRSLSAKDRELLQMRFVDGMTQKEIGLALGVSQMQVSRLVRAVLEKLRAAMGVTVDDTREVAAVA